MTGYLVNPLFLYLAVWVSVAALYTGGLWTGLFPSAAPQLAWAVLLNVATFALGYLTWNTLVHLRATDGMLPRLTNRPLTSQQLGKYLNVTLCFGLLAVALCVVRVVILADIHEIELRRLVSDPTLWRNTLTDVITPDMVGIRLCTIGITLADSVFSIGFVLLGILIYVGRSRWRYTYVLLFLLTSISAGMVSLARKEVTINILFAVLSYLFMHQLYRTRRPREVAWHLLAPVAAGVVLFLLIELVLQKGATYERQSRLLGFLFSIYWYLASPLAAFGEFLKSHSHDWRLGQSLFFPFYKWLVRFHLLAPTDTTNIVHMEMIFVPYPANVYTYLRNIYEDFGFIGLAVVPYLLGALAASIRYQARRCLACLNLYMVVLIVVIFSFYNHLLISIQFYMQIFFGFIIFRHQLDRTYGIDAER
ncbi:MAG: oligosaccharide repeat unit polymerase [Phycisphaerales bacterium]|nr:MAG: oligosaccharide repeat unit polymerase [Phycisphaerales bacterium]